MVPIKVRCEGCKKTLSVKPHLAGKRVACPVCKKPLVIPVPTAAPAGPPPEDVEALAAAALFEDPAAKQAEEEAAATTIDFTCSWCDEALHFNIELAGKQEPCPHCKRIVKVPIPKDHRPKNWREVKGGPAVARMRDEKLEGVMSSNEKGGVSLGALEEAGALPPEQKEPVPVRVWVRRGLLAVVGLAAVVVGWIVLSNYLTNNQQEDELKKALEAKLPPLPSAAIYRAAGEYYTRTRQADKAQESFRKAAQAPFAATKDSAAQQLERDAFLIDLALTWVDLGGTDEEDLDKVKLHWKKVQKELGEVLLAIRSPEALQTGLREVGGKLIKAGKPELAQVLAVQVVNVINTKAAPPDGGETAAQKAAKTPLSAQKIAFLLKDHSEDAKAIAAPPDKNTADPIARQGYAEGYARGGDFSKAEDVAKAAGPPLECLQAALGVAAVALQAEKAEVAGPLLVFAREQAAKARKAGVTVPAWDLLQLSRLLAQAGKTTEAKEMLAQLPDKTTKARRNWKSCWPAWRRPKVRSRCPRPRRSRTRTRWPTRRRWRRWPGTTPGWGSRVLCAKCWRAPRSGCGRSCTPGWRWGCRTCGSDPPWHRRPACATIKKGHRP